MNASPAPIDSLKLCNSLILGNERRDMERAARFAAAGREGDAERIRERLGYSVSDCRIDVDKVTRHA